MLFTTSRIVRAAISRFHYPHPRPFTPPSNYTPSFIGNGALHKHMPYFKPKRSIIQLTTFYNEEPYLESYIDGFGVHRVHEWAPGTRETTVQTFDLTKKEFRKHSRAAQRLGHVLDSRQQILDGRSSDSIKAYVAESSPPSANGSTRNERLVDHFETAYWNESRLARAENPENPTQAKGVREQRMKGSRNRHFLGLRSHIELLVEAGLARQIWWKQLRELDGFHRQGLSARSETSF